MHTARRNHILNSNSNYKSAMTDQTASPDQEIRLTQLSHGAG
ncbi:uncharacterized protein METZ01_LOCUS102995 [marine metagenome]|uniref:Uncharacterized protein n=1 Tax=marine metagenome TaxID=408172 RepID=A0A381WCV1_9ZZZZ